MPIILSGGGGGGLGNVVLTGTPSAGQAPLATDATDAAWSYPPGFEISYTQRTTSIAIASTTESSGTTVLSPAAATFDGGAVIVEFFCAHAIMGTGSVGTSFIVSLFEGATQIGRIAWAETQTTTAAVGFPLVGRYRFTPSAASHTYTVTAFVSSTTGAPTLQAGAAGTGAAVPTFVRFTKA